MEINIENAFVIFVRISLRPFTSSYEGISSIVEKFGYQLLNGLLERPVKSTMLLISLMIILMSILTVPAIILIIVFCSVVVIFIFEVLILGAIVILAAVFTILTMGCLILLLGCIRN